MAQLNDLMVMGQSTLLGPTKIDSIIDKNGSNGSTSSSTADKVLKSDDSGKLYWANDNNTMYSPGTGLSLTNTTFKLVKATASTLGGVMAAAVRTNDKPSKTTGQIATSRYYGVELDKDGVMFVNVPWTDYSAGSNITITSSNAIAVNSNPSFSTVTAGSFYANSDKRLKENLMPLIPQKSILDLPIYKYDFIKGAKNQIGCMAQDLQQICPEIVDEDGQGYLSIQESKIVYLLIDEVKKLKEEIKELRGTNHVN